MKYALLLTLSAISTPAFANAIIFSTPGATTFTAPADGDYTIIAFGAAGGNTLYDDGVYLNSGGAGAEIGGTFTLTAGEILTIDVGSVGATVTLDSASGAGGGGGTFVVDPNGNILVIAGGGGGAGIDNINGVALGNGAGGVVGNAGTNNNGNAGAGGTGGAGGAAGANGPDGGGGGGGGFYSAGGSGSNPVTGGGGGGSFADGLSGGASDNAAQPSGAGGFGGGGGGSNIAGGGGGGYSGGGGGDDNSLGFGGGGGGSYDVLGTSQIAIAAENFGEGSVDITFQSASVPEPASLLLIASGLAALIAFHRRSERFLPLFPLTTLLPATPVNATSPNCSIDARM